MQTKPAFNPEKDYTVVGKPPFDPSKPFDLAPMLKEPEAPKPPTMEEVLSIVRSEIAKIKPQVIDRVIETKTEVIREVEKKDDKKDQEIKDLKETVSQLKKKLEEVSKKADNPIIIPMGGAGVIGIPPPEPNEGKTLKVVDGKASWVTVTGSGGASLEGFTVSNGTEKLSFDANDTTIDELADVISTIIDQLQA